MLYILKVVYYYVNNYNYFENAPLQYFDTLRLYIVIPEIKK